MNANGDEPAIRSKIKSFAIIGMRYQTQNRYQCSHKCCYQFIQSKWICFVWSPFIRSHFFPLDFTLFCEQERVMILKWKICDNKNHSTNWCTRSGWNFFWEIHSLSKMFDVCHRMRNAPKSIWRGLFIIFGHVGKGIMFKQIKDIEWFFPFQNRKKKKKKHHFGRTQICTVYVTLNTIFHRMAVDMSLSLSAKHIHMRWMVPNTCMCVRASRYCAFCSVCNVTFSG